MGIKSGMPTIRQRFSSAAVALLGPSPAPAAAPASTPPPAETISRGVGQTQRADVVGVNGATTGASIVNPLSGLGSVEDSGAQARPALDRNVLNADELVALMRGTLYRRICEVLPQDALAHGITITDDTNDPSPLAAELEDFGVLDQVCLAATWGRALGEAYLWPIVEDGGRPLSSPLDISAVTRVYALQAFDVRELIPHTWQSSLYGRRRLGLPETYQIQPNRMGANVHGIVHHSRLLHFWGDDLPPSAIAVTPHYTRGDAIGQTLWDALRDLSQTGSAGARLAQELSIAVFYLANLGDKDAGRGRDALRAAWTRIMRWKSVAHGVILGTSDKAERLPAHAAGFRELSEAQWDLLQAITGIPAARLRGMSPGGLSTDGDSWQQAYYADVGSWRWRRLRSPLSTLIRLLYRHRGQAEPKWSMQFGEFYQLSALEKAQLRLSTAQGDQLAMDAGLVTREQVRRSRYGAGGFQLDLQAPTEEDQRELDLAPDDTDPAAAEAVLADLTGAGDPAALTAEQVKLVQDVLANVSAGKLKAPAAEILLAAVLPQKQALALVAAQVGTIDADEGEADAPDLSNQRALAAAMTAHGVERCEHNAVNRCRICGIERDRALVLGADGQPTRNAEGKPVWAVRWRAMGDPDPTPDATTRADADDFRRTRFKVPSGAKGNARKVLAWKDEHGADVQGMTDTGWARARQLASDDTVTGQDLIEMAAWFTRHGATKATRQVAAEFEGEPWRDAGWVSWLGWGGDTAKVWAEEAVDRSRTDADHTGKALLAMALSEAGRAAWRDLVTRVTTITGPLEGYEADAAGVQEPPHVTLLYLGATNPADLPEIQTRAAKVVEGFGSVALRARKVGTFPAGPASEGRVPVVAELDAWELGDLNSQLLRALARFVSADQFDRFRAHVTLGFAPGLTPEQVAALAEMLGSAEPLPMGSAAAVDLHHGGDVVARLPMLGKRTDGLDPVKSDVCPPS